MSTATSPLYSGPVTVNTTTTLRAIGILSGWTNITMASATYTLRVATPTFNPGGGTYRSPQSVTITTTTPAAQIRYTTDGITPTATSPVYTGPILVDARSTTIKAIAVLPGWTDSTVGSETYRIR